MMTGPTDESVLALPEPDFLSTVSDLFARSCALCEYSPIAKSVFDL